MNNDLLATYIHDHLAGASESNDMLGDLCPDPRGEHLGDFAAFLLSEIEEDRETLQKLADDLGGRLRWFSTTTAHFLRSITTTPSWR